ncbi:hypothetical protein Hanom_Chr07g00624001 [Helianthus anomalus]
MIIGIVVNRVESGYMITNRINKDNSWDVLMMMIICCNLGCLCLDFCVSPF